MHNHTYYFVRGWEEVGLARNRRLWGLPQFPFTEDLHSLISWSGYLWCWRLAVLTNGGPRLWMDYDNSWLYISFYHYDPSSLILPLIHRKSVCPKWKRKSRALSGNTVLVNKVLYSIRVTDDRDDLSSHLLWMSFWGKHEMPSIAGDQQPDCCICSCRLSELVDNGIWPFGSMLLSNSIKDPSRSAWLTEKGRILQGRSCLFGKPVEESSLDLNIPGPGGGGESRVFLFEGPPNTDISEISSYLSVRFGVYNVFESLC